MKKIALLCLALIMGLGITTTEAKKPVKKQIKTVVFATDIDCNHCVQKIMNNVPVLGKGIKDVQVDLPKKEVTVIYDAAKNDVQQMIHALETLKVKAEVKPEEKAPQK